jgi:hypothetical protein
MESETNGSNNFAPTMHHALQVHVEIAYRRTHVNGAGVCEEHWQGSRTAQLRHKNIVWQTWEVATPKSISQQGRTLRSQLTDLTPEHTSKVTISSNVKTIQ